MSCRVRDVHLHEIAGEEIGLLTAFGSADLDEDLLPVVGVLRQHQLTQFRLQRRRLGCGLVDLVLEQSLLVALGIEQHLPRRLGVVEPSLVPAERLDHGHQLVVPLRRHAQLVGIGDHLGVGELPLEIVVLLGNETKAVQHDAVNLPTVWVSRVCGS